MEFGGIVTRESIIGREAMARPGGDASSRKRRRDVPGARWYVVHTQPWAEMRAFTHLVRQDFNLFLPRYRTVVSHARRRTSTLMPLFPSYLFVRLDVSRDQWRSINGTRGVVRLIAHGDTPAPVPAGVVEGLRAFSGTDGVMEFIPSLDIGQRARVVAGPFADCIGTLERLDGAGRVRLLLELLGRSVPVSLPGDALQPAG